MFRYLLIDAYALDRQVFVVLDCWCGNIDMAGVSGSGLLMLRHRLAGNLSIAFVIAMLTGSVTISYQYVPIYLRVGIRF